jgi:hypothetical protein
MVFRIRIVRIAIRMVLHREPPIGFLDLSLRGVSGQIQELVVILLRHYSSIKKHRRHLEAPAVD